MSVNKKDSKKLRQYTATGDSLSSGLLDGSTTTEIIHLTTVASKVTLQSSDTLAYNYDISANGINFVAVGAVAANALASYNAHNILAIKITRTGGSGRVSVLAVS